MSNRKERRRLARMKANGQKAKPKVHVSDAIAKAVRAKDYKTAAELLQQAAQRSQPPPPNAEAEPVVMGIQLEDVPITVGSGICPGCNAPMVKQPLPGDMVVRLRAGQQVKAMCANCGQRQIIKTDGGTASRILKPNLVLK
jgi:hypothetical protein